MSQTTGKTSTYIKNANVKESSQIQTGFRNTRFLHQAVAGDTLIQLASLTTPDGVVNYSAPSVSDLSKTNLMQWSSNLQLVSSDKGVLIENVSYVVTGATTIKLLFDALDGEIFEGKINHQARTGLTLVDGAPLVQSGTLEAGDTDFNVGASFQVGLYSSTSHGSVLVYVDGQLMYRNTGNNPMGAGVTGDYYEVHSGAGLGQIIRFNTPDLINDRQVSVVSVGSIIERPDGSVMAVSESLQGQIDAMVPTLAALAGVDETDFQATPNNVDLKSFGDRVFALEQILDLEIPYMTDWVNNGVVVIDAVTTAPTKGTATIVVDLVRSRRVGSDMHIRMEYRQTAAGTATAGTGDYLFTVPGGELIDTGKVTALGGVTIGSNVNAPMNNVVGFASWYGSAAGTQIPAGGVMVYDTTRVRIVGILTQTGGNNSSMQVAGSVSSALTVAAQHFFLDFVVPIQGWTAKQTVRQALGL